MTAPKNRRYEKHLRSLKEPTRREMGLAKPPPSRTGKKSVSVYLPPEKRRKLKILAVTTDTTINALLQRAVDLVLAEHKSKPAERPGSKRSGGKDARRRAHVFSPG